MPRVESIRIGTKDRLLFRDGPEPYIQVRRLDINHDYNINIDSVNEAYDNFDKYIQMFLTLGFYKSMSLQQYVDQYD